MLSTHYFQTEYLEKLKYRTQRLYIYFIAFLMLEIVFLITMTVS